MSPQAKRRPVRISRKQQALRDEATAIWKRFGETLRRRAGLPPEATPEFMDILKEMKDKRRRPRSKNRKET